MKEYLKIEDKKSAKLLVELADLKNRQTGEQADSDKYRMSEMLNRIKYELEAFDNLHKDILDIASEIFTVKSLSNFYRIESRLIKEGWINESAIWVKDQVDLIYLINIMASNNYFQKNYPNRTIISQDDIYAFFEDRYKVKLEKYQSWVWMQDVEDNEYIPWLKEYF